MKKILSLIFIVQLIQLNYSQTTENPTTNEPWGHRCYTCEGDLKSECAHYQRINTNSTICPNNDIPDYRYKCYISVINGIVRRGCRSDKFCDYNNCIVSNYGESNFIGVANQECIRCSSLPGFEYNPMCEEKSNEISPTNCFSSGYYTFNERGCYSIRIYEFYNGENVTYVKRGCFMRREPECNDDNDLSCIVCREDGCNTHDIGFSRKLNPDGVIIFLAVFIISQKIIE